MKKKEIYLVTWVKRCDDGPLPKVARVEMTPEDALALEVSLQLLENNASVDAAFVELEPKPISYNTYVKNFLKNP